MSLADRYKPTWQRCWDDLPASVKLRVMAFKWAFCVNLFLLAALSVTLLALQEKTPLVLTLSFTARQEPEQVIEIAPLQEEEAEKEEEQEPEPKPEPLPAPETRQEPVAAAEPAQEAEDNEEGEAQWQGDANAGREAERRVRMAGGELDGLLRISLSFDGDDDIDLHVLYQGMDRYTMQGGRSQRQQVAESIWYANRQTLYGTLDVDANATYVVPEPCENVVFHHAPVQAKYNVMLHHYAARFVPDRTPYTVVVAYGNVRRVFKGHISPSDGFKSIYRFTFHRPRRLPHETAQGYEFAH